MRFYYSFLALLTSLSALSQTTVTVDAGNVLRTLSGIENGINLDYLMDGSYLSPSISTTQSLRNVKAKLLRYPGGEKSDNYLFSKAPYTSASPRMALLDTCYWPTNDYKFVDTNSTEKLCWPAALDFDEFIGMCHTVGAEPMVVVAYDAAYNTRECDGKPTKSQLLTNAVEWVRYANIKKGWNVKYWMIGNESWHDPKYNGRVTPSQYANDIEDFATAMKAVDPSIKIIANGTSGWWETIVKSNAVSLIDFLGLSEYPVLNYTGGYDYYRNNNVNLTGEIDAAINDINSFAPVAHRSRLKVIATEYSSIDWGNGWASVNNLGHALVNFQMFGDIVINPKLETACMWNTRWVGHPTISQNLYDAFDEEGNLNATGKVMNMWGINLLSSMVSAVSDGPYVKSYASYDENSRMLNIFLLNKDYSSKQVDLSILNYESDYKGSIWQLSGTSVNDKFPNFVRMDSIFEPDDISSFTLPSNSVTVLRLQRDDVALPLTLISFEAKKNVADITLQWKTANEKKIDEYIIERSDDGEIFSAIGKLAAQKADSALYNFTDLKIHNSQVVFYRLVIVDTEGKKTSSRVVSVIINTRFETLFAHPNPFENSVQLKMSSDTEKTVSVVIIDVSGKAVRKEKAFLNKGNNVIEINDLQELRTGLYMIKVSDDSFTTIVKVVKK